MDEKRRNRDTKNSKKKIVFEVKGGLHFPSKLKEGKKE